jgi:hypothetical protein
MSQGGPRRTPRTELLLRQDLASFHSLMTAPEMNRPGVDGNEAPLAVWASERLRAEPGIDLRWEAAWALLRAEMTQPAEDDDRAGAEETATAVAPEDGVKHSFERWRRLLCRLSDPGDFLTYLGRFPAGDLHAAYRQDRQQTAKSWIVHVHPDPALLEAFLTRRDELGAELSQAVERHLRGPYHCLACRRYLQRLLPSGTRERWAPMAHLAAASRTPSEAEWSVQAQVGAIHCAYTLRCVDDRGYLRIFLQTKEEDARARATFRLQIFFRGGVTLEETINYPEHSLIGVNLGKLGNLCLEDMISLLLSELAGSER